MIAGKIVAGDGPRSDPDELAPVPTHRKIAAKKHTDPASLMALMRDDDAALDAVPKYSKEWVALYMAKQERDDAKLNRTLPPRSWASACDRRPERLASC